MNKYTLIIIIPCYNEMISLISSRYRNFIDQLRPNILVLFVDDNSTDKSVELINNLNNNNNNNNIQLIQNSTNIGKAESIRNGFEYVLHNFDFEKVAFLDADLATPLHECIRLSELINNQYDVVFGSRILRIGAKIKRNYFRHIIGRGIATLISMSLHLSIYDTQCGCKIFKKNIAEKIFKKVFISKWLFDVELFFRIKNENKNAGKKHTNLLEVPLDEWVEYGDSKVKTLYFFKLFIDLYKINKEYNWNK